MLAGVASGTLIALVVSGVLAAAGLLSTSSGALPAANAGARVATPVTVQPCLSPRGVFCSAPVISKRNHHPSATTKKKKPASSTSIAAP